MWVLCSYTCKAFDVNKTQGIVSLTFDDGYACHHEIVEPLLGKYGYLGTFYVTTSQIDQPHYLTSIQVVELSQKGHEIASHCVNHVNLKKLSRKQLEFELVESKRILEQLIQQPVSNFAFPFGIYNPLIMYRVKQHYRLCRTIARYLNTRDRSNRFSIGAHVVLNTTTLKEVQGWLDRAISENKWLVLVYHHIDDAEGFVNITKEVFESHLQEIHIRQIPVVTIQETN